MLGHTTGDVVLCAIAERLKAVSPSVGIVARLGDEEFAIAVLTSEIAGDVSGFAEQISASFAVPLLAGNREHSIRVRIGAAVYPKDGHNADVLLSNSHMALSRANVIGHGSHVMGRGLLALIVSFLPRSSPVTCL
jgi:diguanylate cyclase (GGDEF)-like protein